MNNDNTPSSDPANDATPLEQSPPLEKSIAQERDEYLAGWQRATADYRNLQQSRAREREQLTKYANRSLLTELLELADAFRDAQRVAPSDNIAQLDKKFHQLLAQQSVTSLDTKAGDVFDPTLHESLGGSGERIAQIVQQGYKLNDIIIRPTRVILG